MRETLRKIASLGQELPSRPFLTLLWARMLQKNNLLETRGAGLGTAMAGLARLLAALPKPVQVPQWTFFSGPEISGEVFNSAQEFWLGLQNEEFNAVWQSPQTLGWSYQFFLEPQREVFRSPRAPKVTAGQLAVQTQQFTPKWIADFLAANTLGRLWLQIHPDSDLAKAMPYLVPEPADRPRLALKLVREITVLDPACGTMHLGLSAMELLTEMYREEFSKAGRPGWPEAASVSDLSEIPSAIFRHNLFGIDIDPLAVEVAALTLFLGAQGAAVGPPKLLCVDALKKDLPLQLVQGGFPSTFDVLLLNPPYLDKRDYHPKLKAFMARNYSKSGRNLYTAFLEQSVDLLSPGGRLGAVTPQTFMFIRSFEALRKILLERTVLETLVHTGLNTFDDAVVDCAFYILRREPDPEARSSNIGRFLQLTTPTNSEEKHAGLNQILSTLRQKPGEFSVLNCFPYRQADFNALPGHPWVYWISPRIRRLFSEQPPLGQIAELRQGLATTHNDRFLRYGWEIPRGEVAWDCRSLADAEATGKKWFPYMKGGGYSKWYGCREFLVNWQHDGKEIKAEITKRYPYLKGNWQWVAKNTTFYFREGITYSYLTSGKFSARYSPAGSIFDVAGSSIFCEDLHLVLAILNSRFCRFALGLINPTVNFQVGDLQRLPIPPTGCPAHLRDLVEEAIDLAKSQETFEETSPAFVAPPPWPEGLKTIERKNQRLMQIQRLIDKEIYRLYDLDSADQKLIEQQTTPDFAADNLTDQKLAFRWVSYAVGLSLGRFGSKAGKLLCPVDEGNLLGLAEKVQNRLDELLGPEKARKIIQLACPSEPLGRYLGREFFEQHFQLYRQRPVYWLLKLKSGLFAMYYQNLDQEKVLSLVPKFSGEFTFDDGIRANMKHFRRILALPAWKK
jgi:hypothetical protein